MIRRSAARLARDRGDGPAPVLTYVVATRNKLDTLRVVLASLARARAEDEEVVVVDGASTDGAAEFLAGEADEGRLDLVLSEPDRGEAHAWNKAFLLARGDLIKVVTDDDVFDWETVRACRTFMEAHRSIDVLGTNGAGTDDGASREAIGPVSFSDDYRRWQKDRTPFSFSGLGLLIRRDSLPLVGLFHTDFYWVDAEFTLRLTAGRAQLAWYTGRSFLRILNDGSKTTLDPGRMERERRALFAQYLGAQPEPEAASNAARRSGGSLRAWVKRLVGRSDWVGGPRPPIHWGEMFARGSRWLRERATQEGGEFLLPAAGVGVEPAAQERV